jgi:hypothetical protein
VVDADVGICDLEHWFAAVGRGHGLLILDGVLAYETRVGDRTATELIGAGDLIQPPMRRADAIVEPSESWRVLSGTRMASLDEEFTERVRPWPQIAEALLRRVARRLAEIDALRAIACQPRLEIRIDLLLWHLAARWGRVEPAGLRLTLPLTHAGLVTGSACDFHLHGTLGSHLEALMGDHDDRHQRSSQQGARRRLAEHG